MGSERLEAWFDGRSGRRPSLANRSCSEHLRNRDEAVAPGLVARDQMISRSDSLGAVGAHLFVAAVMEQDDVATANLPAHLALDHGGRWRVPVVAGHIPHNRFEPQLASHPQHRGPSSAERWAEEIGMLSDCVLQGGAAVREFLSNFSDVLQSQEWMRERVVAHNMAGIDDLARDLGTLPDVASDPRSRLRWSISVCGGTGSLGSPGILRAGDCLNRKSS